MNFATLGLMTSWLSDREQQAWLGLLQLTATLQAELNRELQADHGISLADYEVLGRLHDADGGNLRTVELTATLTWEQSRVSHQLARMQRRDLVSRDDCADDRRGSVYTLTDLGRSTIERAAPDHVAGVRRLLFDRLTSDQIGQLAALTSHVLTSRDQEQA